MGKMSDVQRYAEAIRKDPRTVRRWCRAGKIRGKRHGDSWRIEPLEIQKAEMRKDLRDYFGPPTARNKRMFEATLFVHGIDDPRNSKKLYSKSPKKWRFVYLNYQHDAEAHLVMDDPSAWIKKQTERLGRVPKAQKFKKMLDVAHLETEEPLAWLRLRIERQVQKLGRIPKLKELEKMMPDVSRAQLYRAEPKLIKKLKRRFSQDPTATPERQPLDKPWDSAAKKKPKENLNWRHDGKD
jgi:hypothetical protein